MKNVAQAKDNTEQMGHDLTRTGFLRLNSILAPLGPIPVGRSTWWEGVKTGLFPKQVKLGPRTTAWKVEDIRDLIERVS
jgi:prophage regulatory protein